MGIEYTILVPDADHAAVSVALKDRLGPLLQALDPTQNGSHPHISVTEIQGGVYVCDHLSDRTVASRVIRELIDLLLSHSVRVTIVEL